MRLFVLLICTLVIVSTVSLSNAQGQSEDYKQEFIELRKKYSEYLTDIEQGLKNDHKDSAAEYCKIVRLTWNNQFEKQLNDSVDFAEQYKQYWYPFFVPHYPSPKTVNRPAMSDMEIFVYKNQLMLSISITTHTQLGLIEENDLEELKYVQKPSQLIEKRLEPFIFMVLDIFQKYKKYLPDEPDYSEVSSSSNDDASREALKRDLSETITLTADALFTIEQGLQIDGKSNASENCKNIRNSFDDQFFKQLNDSIDFAFKYQEYFEIFEYYSENTEPQITSQFTQNIRYLILNMRTMINQIRLGLIEDKRYDELKTTQEKFQILDDIIPNGFKKSLYIYERYGEYL